MAQHSPYPYPVHRIRQYSRSTVLYNGHTPYQLEVVFVRDYVRALCEKTTRFDESHLVQKEYLHLDEEHPFLDLLSIVGFSLEFTKTSSDWILPLNTHLLSTPVRILTGTAHLVFG